MEFNLDATTRITPQMGTNPAVNEMITEPRIWRSQDSTISIVRADRGKAVPETTLGRVRCVCLTI